MKPIAITMGDSSGVGPEIILHAHRKRSVPPDVLVVGDLAALECANEQLGYAVPLRSIQTVDEIDPRFLNVLNLGLLARSDLRPGQVSRLSGAAALRYVERAAHLALDRKVAAVVTLPIHKEATRLSAPDFTGHTEFIAQLCNESNYTMMLASDRLIVTHVSTHLSLRRAIECVTPQRVRTVIELTDHALKKLRPRRRIAVAGLNPHAGESGAFGTEDRDAIAPAIERARNAGFDVHGPCPADTVFKKAADGSFDAVVCMYHDQGHIPLKLLDFEGGINVTLGLPIVRTSVDHGTAFDIAYQGKAFTRSLEAACDLARRLTDVQTVANQ